MEAITREEKIISGENLTPITRKEMFLAKAAGMDVETPEPITREEMFLSKISGGDGGAGGGGGSITTKVTNAAYLYVEMTIDAETIGQAAFNNNKTIQKLTTNAKTIDAYAFQSCAQLTLIDLTAVETFGYYAFKSCQYLSTVIIRSPSIPTLPEWAVFQYCSDPYFYVPRALVEVYKTSATNWLTFADKFRPLEDYTVDGTITGAFDTTKI